MPESLTRRANAADVSGGCPASFRNGVRLRVGTVSGFARNRVRHCLGISVRLQSDFAISGSHEGERSRHSKAEYMTEPECFADSQFCSCTAGAIHTGHTLALDIPMDLGRQNRTS